MVSIIENWSDITGQIRSLMPAPDLKEFLIARVFIERVQAVEGFPSLLGETAGTEQTIYIPTTLAEKCRVVSGTHITGRVRKANQQRIFVHHEHFACA